MANEIICNSCGARCSDNASYCPSCYSSLQQQIEVEADDDHCIDGIDENIWKEFMGPQSADFVQLLKKNKHKKLFVRANAFAFLLPMQWFFCHKMYLAGTAYQLATYAIYLLLLKLYQYSFYFIFLLVPIALLMNALVSIFANTLYKEHVRKELSKPNPKMKKGGLSYGAAIAATIIFYLITIFCYEPLLLLLSI